MLQFRVHARAAAFMLLVWLNSACAATAQEQRLQGDERAVAAVERMLERLGGRETWAGARTLYLEYRVWRTDPDEHLIERAWRDLRQPNQRIELNSPSSPLVWAFTEDGGWSLRNGATATISESGHASALEFWPYDFYTIIRNFAVADPRMTLEFVPPRRVVVRGPAGADWGWWEIDSNGAPIRWGAVTEGETLEYVYGPLRTYGAIRFPAWGSATNGAWRFEYAEVLLSPEPIAPDQLTPPR